MKKYLYF